MTNSNTLDHTSMADLARAFEAAESACTSAYAACDRIEGAIVAELGRRPFGRCGQAVAWDARRAQIAEELDLVGADHLADRASKAHACALEQIRATPARSLADLAVKARVAARWCDPDPILRALVADIEALAGTPA